MKVRIAKNEDAIDGGMDINPEEIAGKIGIERVAQLSKDGINIAMDIFKKYPEIKQVTLDTMTDEERALIQLANVSNIKN